MVLESLEHSFMVLIHQLSGTWKYCHGQKDPEDKLRLLHVFDLESLLQGLLQPKCPSLVGRL